MLDAKNHLHNSLNCSREGSWKNWGLFRMEVIDNESDDFRRFVSEKYLKGKTKDDFECVFQLYVFLCFLYAKGSLERMDDFKFLNAFQKIYAIERFKDNAALLSANPPPKVLEIARRLHREKISTGNSDVLKEVFYEALEGMEC